MKKLIAALTAILVLAGCARQQPEQQEDAPTLTIMTLGGFATEPLARISQALSEITLEEIGCRVSLVQSGRNEYGAALAEKALSNELPDIFAMPNQEELLQFVNNGKCLLLEAYLRQDADWDAVIDAQNWKTVVVGEERYAIPFNNDRLHCFGFLMRADICEELGVDVEKVGDLDSLYELLIQVRDQYPDLYPVVPHYEQVGVGAFWDEMGDGLGVLPYRDGKAVDRIELSVATPEFYEWCQTMYRWNQEGLIMPNASFNTESRLALFASGQAFGGFGNISRWTVSDNSFHLEQTLVTVPLSELRDDCNEARQSFCISASSLYPEESLAFLKLLYTDARVLNLCLYGQEGIDYCLSEEGWVQPLEAVGVQQYTIAGYCWPNRQNAAVLYRPSSFPQSVAQATVVSPAVGFAFDSTPVQSKMEVCATIVERYQPGLLAGELDPDETIPLMLQQLQEAGVEDVLQEKQRQYDQWLARRTE